MVMRHSGHATPAPQRGLAVLISELLASVDGRRAGQQNCREAEERRRGRPQRRTVFANAEGAGETVERTRKGCVPDDDARRANARGSPHGRVPARIDDAIGHSESAACRTGRGSTTPAPLPRSGRHAPCTHGDAAVVRGPAVHVSGPDEPLRPAGAGVSCARRFAGCSSQRRDSAAGGTAADDASRAGRHHAARVDCTSRACCAAREPAPAFRVTTGLESRMRRRVFEGAVRA